MDVHMKNGNINQGMIDKRIRGNLFQPEGDDFSKGKFDLQREEIIFRGNAALMEIRKSRTDKEPLEKSDSKNGEIKNGEQSLKKKFKEMKSVGEKKTIVKKFGEKKNRSYKEILEEISNKK